MIDHFGLDIGSETIKIVQVDKEKAAVKLVAAGMIKNPVSSVSLALDNELILLAEAIAKLKKEARVSLKKVIVSLPERHVFVQETHLPRMKEEELRQAIPWEAESLIPKPLSEVNLDWEILDDGSKSPDGKMKILLVAAPKKLIDSYVKVIKMAGLEIEALVTESIATVKSVKQSVLNKDCLVLNMGAESADILIMKEGNLYLTKSLASSGKAISKAISLKLNLDFNVAEEYKKTYGLSDQVEGKIYSSIEPILSLLAGDIKKAISFYEAEDKKLLKLMILAGGTSLLSGIPEFFTKALNLEVQIADPFAFLQADPTTLAALKKFSPIYTTAVGLALREEEI